MVKKLFLTVAAAGLTALAAGLVSATTLPAEAASLRGMPCDEAAELKYPDDRYMRRNWRKLCKANWKLHQGS
jgi:hypothetical protein